MAWFLVFFYKYLSSRDFWERKISVDRERNKKKVKNFGWWLNLRLMLLMISLFIWNCTINQPNWATPIWIYARCCVWNKHVVCVARRVTLNALTWKAAPWIIINEMKKGIFKVWNSGSLPWQLMDRVLLFSTKIDEVIKSSISFPLISRLMTNFL